MSAAPKLPPEFSDLERFAGEWALATEKERYFKLLATDLSKLRAFFDAMLPRAPAVVAYLSRFPAAAMQEDARRLYDLMLTFVETAHPIELNWKATNIELTVAAERLEFHGPSAAPYVTQAAIEK
ncbi:MAG: hypothetical protein EPO20_25090 [Betaproteobacteria bacterium]|nr:MAG: hypothetical protein EPO20_25090 [Betaproteobacteria bacterium]